MILELSTVKSCLRYHIISDYHLRCLRIGVAVGSSCGMYLLCSVLDSVSSGRSFGIQNGHVCKYYFDVPLSHIMGMPIKQNMEGVIRWS